MLYFLFDKLLLLLTKVHLVHFYHQLVPSLFFLNFFIFLPRIFRLNVCFDTFSTFSRTISWLDLLPSCSHRWLLLLGSCLCSLLLILLRLLLMLLLRLTTRLGNPIVTVVIQIDCQYEHTCSHGSNPCFD